MYYRDKILNEIIPSLYGREVSLLGDYPPVRCMKIDSIDTLKTNFIRWGFYQKHYNIYHSLAHLKGMPIFSFKYTERKHQRKKFNMEFEKYVVDYDLALDFDGKMSISKEAYETQQLKLPIISINKSPTTDELGRKEGEVISYVVDVFNQAVKETATIKTIFDKYKIPYHIKMSGFGFHIYVYGHDFTHVMFHKKDDEQELIDRFDENINLPKVLDKIRLSNLLASKLVKEFELTTLDTSIYDMRRIWKVPYTIDWKTGNVALPLDDWQFDNGICEHLFKPSTVLDMKMPRGVLRREGDEKGMEEFVGKLFHNNTKFWRQVAY